jgi:hypothetical protein
LLGDPDTAYQWIGQDTLNAERTHRPSAWWQAARPFRNKCRGCATFKGLTSGTTRWLTSQASSHATAAGLCLNGERRVGPRRVSAPDPYSSRSPSRPGILLRPGPYSGGPDMPSWELRTRTYRGPVSLYGGPDPVAHPGMYYLSLPRGAFRPTYAVGSSAVLRAVWRCRTGAASSYFRREYP